MSFTRRGVLAVILGTGLAVAAPSLASAHVGVTPDSLAADEATVLTFSFTHGCENSPTTALRITMPDGLASVSPSVDSGWDIAVERGDDGLVDTVTYTAVTPVPSDLRGAVSMQVRPGEDAAETLAFPVEQICETGANEWVELAEDGEDPHDLDAPAPVVALVAGESDGEDGHGEHAASGSATDAEAATGDPLAVALGAGGLVAGVAGLIVAILAYRRRSS
ncbi:YcnI family protein [Microbacterium sp. CIAB417]|uniref:YcnI family copper-binding membrane protein n=1 Tax=Microbacterium sp. CIAB417 TaxID=2860287 RepID=UPI001FAE22AA|nr:YcnI family protein [Microbacterium sp. CIAB417]